MSDKPAPLTDEEERDIRTRRCIEATVTIDRVWATLDAERAARIAAEAGNDSRDDALDILARRTDAQLRQLADAIGISWQGKSHEENVEAAKAMRSARIEADKERDEALEALGGSSVRYAFSVRDTEDATAKRIAEWLRRDSTEQSEPAAWDYAGQIERGDWRR